MKVIRYMIEMAHSAESPEGEITTRSELHQRVLLCHGEADFEAKMVIAKREAYNGEYTIEDDGQPEPPPTTEQRVSDLEEQLAQSDETAIALYEAQEAQEVINAQQDEALMEIYEMIG